MTNPRLRAPESRTTGVEFLIHPTELLRIAQQKKMEAERESLAGAKTEEEREKDLYREFIGRHLRPEAAKRFSEMVRQAAMRGDRKIEILDFPSDWCTDRGRAINNDEKDWPNTLTGIAKEVYEAYERWLRPVGYKLSARIVDYPGGKPGNVGLYISW